MEIFSKGDALYAISISVSLFSGLILIWDMILLFKNRRLASRHRVRMERFLNMVSGQTSSSLSRKLDMANQSLGRLESLRRNELLSIVRETANDSDIVKLRTAFDQLYPGFSTSVNSIIRGITSNEVRLCMLIRLNINTKDIARIQNVSPDSVIKARYRIRKKIGLTSDSDLYQFLSCL